MSPVPLRIGALPAPGYDVRRSGLRWLCEDGQRVRSGEVVAFCNVGLRPAAGSRSTRTRPFIEEEHDFQVAFAVRTGGILRRSDDSSLGGFLDQLQYYQIWTPEFLIGHLECAEVESTQGANDESLRLLMLAGRRVTALADVRAGLLTGWHDRSRAWWSDGGDRFGTLLCLGICEQRGIVRGEQSAFLEIFDAVAGPAQVVYFTDDALVPCASVVAGQLARSPDASREIAADFARSFGTGAVVPTPREWIFAGALLSSLLRSPIAEPQDLLIRGGLQRIESPDAVLMSLNAEPMFVLRHRRLGYTLHCHGFRIATAGPAIHAWLRADFEQVKRAPEDIFRDYCELIDAVRARSETTFLVLNVISTSGSEQVQCYAPFPRPLGKMFGSVRARELNVMLHDLAHQRNVAIVDVDAIAAELGSQRHAPDGIHCSGELQGEIRREILRLLHDRGVPGFAARA